MYNSICMYPTYLMKIDLMILNQDLQLFINLWIREKERVCIFGIFYQSMLYTIERVMAYKKKN